MFRPCAILIVLLVALACSKDKPAPIAPTSKAVAVADAPDAPTNLRVETLTDTSATLAWDAVEGATDYDLNYRTLSGRWTNWPIRGARRAYTTIYRLEPETEYRWAVRAENRDGASRWTFAKNFTTPPAERISEEPTELILEEPATIEEVDELPFNIDLVFSASFRRSFSPEDIEQIRYAASRWEELLIDIPD